MDGVISKRQYPSYTTAQLESFVAAIKANETGSDACMRMIAMQDEIGRRKSGESQVRVIPQLPQSREIVIGTQSAGVFAATPRQKAELGSQEYAISSNETVYLYQRGRQYMGVKGSEKASFDTSSEWKLVKTFNA